MRVALADGVQRPTEAVEQRVAASVMHQGLVARLIAPAIAAKALSPQGISLAGERVWWQDRLGGPFPLSVEIGSGAEHALQDSAVEAITLAVAGSYRVSPRALWGNVASAASSAARLIADARPDLTQAAYAAANAVLSDARTAGQILDPALAFRRRSCCLIYRVDMTRTAVCDDCVLLPAR